MTLKTLDTGKIVIVVIFVLFYLRLFMLRGRKIKQERQAAAQKLRSGGKGKQAKAEVGPSFSRPRYSVTSWWIIGLGVLLMCVGLAVNTTTLFPAFIHPFDWVFIAVGGVLFIFGIK